jgi:hypothetical protein
MNPYIRDHDYTDQNGYYELDSLVYDPFDYYPVFLQFEKEYYNDTTIYDIEFYPGDTTSYLMQLRRVGPTPYDPPMKQSEFAQVPSSFFINQNYPNPFNNRTVIKYGLPRASKVNIEIYDIMGRRVAALLSEYQPAGYHQVNWDADNQRSGVYFYRIKAEGFEESKKMILLK